MWIEPPLVTSVTKQGTTVQLYKQPDNVPYYAPSTLGSRDYIASGEYLDSVPKGRGQWNSCQHYKVRRAISSALVTWRNWYNTTDRSAIAPWWDNLPGVPVDYCWDSVIPDAVPAGQRGSDLYGSSASPNANLPVLWVDDPVVGRSIPDPPGLQSLIDRSLAAMLPEIKPRLSIVNSIYELKDFKSLPRTFRRISDTLGDLDRFINGRWALKRSTASAVTRRGSKSLRRLLRTGSDSYLQSEFNVRPLLSDICGINNALSHVRNELKGLIARAGSLQVRHYVCPLYGTYADKYETKDYTIGTMYCGGKVTFSRTVQYNDPVFHASMEYSYMLDSYNRGELLPRALADSLGVQLNPAIIWNAIPWSFVLDWFAGVGRWIDQFKVRNIEPTTRIYRYLWSYSVKRWCRISLATNVGTELHSSSLGLVPVTDLWEHAYKRVVCNPDITRSITTSGLNPKEFSLAAALALSR